MTARQQLTVDACRAVKPGQVLKCHVVRGLQLRARAGVTTWHLYYRAAGTQRRPVLGYWPALTLEAARAAARALLADIARGADPSADRQNARHAPTVADLASRYQADRAARNKPRTMEEIDRHCRYIVGAIGHVRVADVTERHVKLCLQHVLERRQASAGAHLSAPVAANRVRETLRGMLNYAARYPLSWRPANSNPVAATVKHREAPRRVLAQPEQFPAIGAALETLSLQWPDRVAALWCIMFSGSRVSEILTARFEDWQGDRLVLREHKTDRTGDVRTIYLPRQAQELLRRLPHNATGLLFGGLDRYNVFHAWDVARRQAGCPHLHVRDFRRTFASVALSRGNASLAQIGELFSHKDTATTASYAWLTDTDARALAQRTADEIEAMTKSTARK